MDGGMRMLLLRPKAENLEMRLSICGLFKIFKKQTLKAIAWNASLGMSIHDTVYFALAVRDQRTLLVPSAHLSGPQRTLQCPGDLHDLHTHTQWQRYRCVLNDAVDKFLQDQPWSVRPCNLRRRCPRCDLLSPPSQMHTRIAANTLPAPRARCHACHKAPHYPPSVPSSPRSSPLSL